MAQDLPPLANPRTASQQSGEMDIGKEIDILLNNNSLQNDLLGQNNQAYLKNGFIVSDNPKVDNTGLPYTKVKPLKQARGFKRNIIHWFIPQFGVIKMYINPESIKYSYSKNLQQSQTKGGYSIQYMGEKLPTFSITGTTGTSGIEGINVLYEMYRAEQYAFDNAGLLLAASNYGPTMAQQMFGTAGDITGGLLGSDLGGSLTTQSLGALFGSNTAGNLSNFAFQSVPTLADVAFGIEMYYLGWIFRGYFTSFSFDEKSSDFLYSYNLTYQVTQKRGYRYNNLPFQKSANTGPSSYTTPNSAGRYI